MLKKINLLYIVLKKTRVIHGTETGIFEGNAEISSEIEKSLSIANLHFKCFIIITLNELHYSKGIIGSILILYRSIMKYCKFVYILKKKLNFIIISEFCHYL